MFIVMMILAGAGAFIFILVGVKNTSMQKLLQEGEFTLVEKRRNNGDENIYFYDGRKIFGNKDILESCVDGTHPTDLGFYRMANSLQPIITKLLKK
jgi:signal peptidase I